MDEAVELAHEGLLVDQQLGIQENQDDVEGAGAAPFSLIACRAAITSSQVAGACCGSRPAFSKASLLYHITGVEELNGIEASRPSGRL